MNNYVVRSKYCKVIMKLQEYDKKSVTNRNLFQNVERGKYL